MKHALQHLSAFKRSMTRLLPWPAPLRPDLDQASLLRDLVAGQATAGAVGDAARAVEFFHRRPAAAGFLSVAEARDCAADYGRGKVAWRQALLGEVERLSKEGLRVYARLAEPLGGGLDWSALPTDAHNDRLYRLRPHRFGFLPRMAMASCLGADCLPALRATLEGWIRQVERTGGADDAYYSNLVVIYRLLAVSWATPFLAARAVEGEETAAEICLLLFRILAADVRYLRPLLGDSTPNNHLLADRFAAWFLAACYPELSGQPAAAPLERVWHAELGRQFQGDGSNFEQSLHYHELGCEMALAYLVIALRRGTTPDCVPALPLIARMLRFQAALADRRGNGFALGDTTDDPLLPLDAGGAWARGAWRVLYRELFDRGFPATAEGAAGAERAYWLLAALRGPERPLPLVVSPEPLGDLAAFPDNGYIAFRDDGSEEQLVFRTGPRPGTTVSPGHAMSDLLSVYWSVGGQPVLEPAGTYSYAATDPLPGGCPEAPRDYFRSPSAHNGPVLRGHDPLGQPKGRFRTIDSGARATTRWRALEGVLAWAEGRLEEAGPLNGWRRGVLRLPGRYALVYDRLPALPEGEELACHWQFAPEAVVAVRSSRQVAASLCGLSAYLCASEGVAAADSVKGRQSPAAGWVSRRYGQLEAAPQVICRLRPGASAVAFVIGHIGSGEAPPQVEVPAVGADGLAVVVRQGDSQGIAIFGRFCGALEGGSLDIDFDGEVLWLGLRGDRCVEARALGLHRLSSEALGLELADVGEQRDPAGWRRLAVGSDSGGLCGHWSAASHA